MGFPLGFASLLDLTDMAKLQIPSRPFRCLLVCGEVCGEQFLNFFYDSGFERHRIKIP
jgi:hypothetical protein